ncbi:MAG: hypothetical protein LBQ33_05840 [Oscillospiraceae bacterium]|jgi:hypothetical protein|nr:hypothetical protein [Oscillospiraceae bacterium]
MKHWIKKSLGFCIALVFLFSAAYIPGYAADGKILVNGETFTGSFNEAVRAAGVGGVVEISGKVYTRPVGWEEPDGFILHDITIRGAGTGAVLALERFYLDDISNKKDVLTVQGDNVTVQNLTIQAGLRVDFPLRTWGNNFLMENVVCVGGTRGAVNILGLRTGKTMTFRNVKANSSVQGGFYFDDDTDCAGLTMENCSTGGNMRVGVLVRNTYNSVQGLDLSGIACKEGLFAVEDRTVADLEEGKEIKEIQILAPPKDASGQPVDTSKALNISFIEGKYQHIRYGAPAAQYAGIGAEIDTVRYGFSTKIGYTLPSAAEYDAREGESVIYTGDWYAQSLGKAAAFLDYGVYSLERIVRMLFAAVS